MLSAILPAAISAASSLASGFLNKKSNEQANQQAQQNALRQEQLQKEFAQSGIQWKVQDAEKAGIHPLYALGAQTTSYAPQSVGTNPTDFSFLADAGQNVGRAIDAGRTSTQRMSALAQTSAAVQLEGLGLDNEIKRAQLASLLQTTYQAGHPPGMPDLTGPSAAPSNASVTGPTTEIKNTLSPTAPGSANIEYGATPEVTLVRTKTGYAPMIPQQLSESMEQDWPSRYQWMARNKIVADPNVMRIIPNRPGRRKHFNPIRGEYYHAKYPTYQKYDRKWGFIDIRR